LQLEVKKVSECKSCEEALIKLTKNKLCSKYNLSDEDCKELANLIIKGIIEGKTTKEISEMLVKFIKSRRGSDI